MLSYRNSKAGHIQPSSRTPDRCFLFIYVNTIKTPKDLIEKKCPGVQSKEECGNSPISYLLWMTGEIEKMDESQAKKAACWIGYVLCAVEEIFGLLTNKKSRELVKKDCSEGFE